MGCMLVCLYKLIFQTKNKSPEMEANKMKKILIIVAFFSLLGKVGISQTSREDIAKMVSQHNHLPDVATLEDSIFKPVMGKYQLSEDLSMIFAVRIKDLQELAIKASQTNLFYSGNWNNTYSYWQDRMSCQHGNLECWEFLLDTFPHPRLKVVINQLRPWFREGLSKNSSANEGILIANFIFECDSTTGNCFISGEYGLLQYYIQRSFPPRVTYMKLSDGINKLEEALLLSFNEKLLDVSKANAKKK